MMEDVEKQQQQQQPQQPQERKQTGTRVDMENKSFNNFDDTSIRHAFIRKVFLIVMVQLMITTITMSFFILDDDLKLYLQENRWVFHVSYGFFIVLYFLLVCPCCGRIGRIVPFNYILLLIFTIALSFMVSVITSSYTNESVLYALGATIIVVFILILFACQTSIDFTSCGGIICIFSMIFMIYGLAVMIYFLIYGPSKILQMIYSALATFVFSLYLIVDIQMLMSGKNRAVEYEPEDYVLASIQIYLDIVQLFISILGLMGDED